MAYFPNSSCPGAARFDSECASCPHGEESCPVACVHLIYNYEQCGNTPLKEAMKILVDDDGTCMMKKLILPSTENPG